ncbi:MAG TPA: MotA/TolQ/ExbB proton channel family protein [Pyrinomonadaceae bacterium]|jgi:hypothetical protein|nr:MotA/TolQ/ExbB proton channel family protein [Pyrinomonadaceae bacterium]
MNYRKLLYAGVGVFVLSTITGIAGTIWNINGSFNALEKAENAGIGSVGASIERALVFSFIGFVGSLIGIGLMIFAAIKLRKKS